jgi:hypothetical protein
MDIVILLFDFHFELVKAKADPSLPHPNEPKPGWSGTPVGWGWTKSLG